MRAAFGDCVFDAEARTLTREGREVVLTPKALELLQALLAARPQALSKAELRDRMWPRTFVSDTSLAQVVSEVRKALGDEARRPRYLRTLHRYGYAFCGEVREEEAPAGSKLRTGCALLLGEREVLLDDGENLLGRGPESVVRLGSDQASRRHARIVVTGGEAVIEDLGSKNGTYLNGRRLTAPVPLGDRDRIVVGRTLLIFSASPPLGSTRTGSRS